MAETQIKGINVGDKTINAVDVDFSAAAAKSPVIDADSLYMLDSVAPTELKRVALSAMKTYVNSHPLLSIDAAYAGGLRWKTGKTVSDQILALDAVQDNGTAGVVLIADYNAWNAKVSFPGFGTTHTLAAYGDHTHSGYEPAITKDTGYLKWTGSAWSFVNDTYALASHLHIGTYEPAITKATGYLKWTGSAWSFVNETYSLSSHTHTGTYDNYNKWTVQAYNGTSWVSKDITTAATLQLLGKNGITLDTTALVSGTRLDIMADSITSSRAKLASDEAMTTSDYMSGLIATVKASAYYQYRIVLMVKASSNSITARIRPRWASTGAVVLYGASCSGLQGVMFDYFEEESSSRLPAGYFALDTTYRALIFEGFLYAPAAGSHFKVVVEPSGGTVTVKAGSSIVLTEIT